MTYSKKSEEKIAQINDILKEMQDIWDKSHTFIDEKDFEKLLEIYKNFPDKNLADRLWKKNNLPADFKFQRHKFVITEELCAWLHPEYCKEHKIDILNPGANFHFHLTANDIINMKIPSQVAECTGHAKLFAALAQKHGLECDVVITADLPKKQGKHCIDNHNIIAVKMGSPEKRVAFDPHDTFKELPEEPIIGQKMQSITDPAYPKYTVTAIVPGDKFEKMVNSYQDLENMCLRPKMQMLKFAAKNMGKKIIPALNKQRD